MTQAERKMWAALRNRGVAGVKFRRQHPIGPFIADFAAVELKLIVEIDGGQHGQETDARRSRYLEAQGWRIVRYWNNDVLGNIDGVIQDLTERLNTPSSRQQR